MNILKLKSLVKHIYTALSPKKKIRYFGASSASYQVDGLPEEIKTNWTVYEHSPDRLFDEADHEKYGEKNYVCGIACDHYHRYKEDFLLAKDLGHNATRFGAEPARIMPEPGVINHMEIRHYLFVAMYLRTLNIEPFFNIWHWTMPYWFDWLSNDALTHWKLYVNALVPILSPYIKYWVTLNETNVYAMIGYQWGRWPPNHTSDEEYKIVSEKLAEAHKIAYRVIKECNPDAQVGMAQNISARIMVEDTEEQRTWCEQDGSDWNWYFLDMIKDYQDFVGVNNYNLYKFGGNASLATSDLGWDLEPLSLYHAVKIAWERYHLPILVTENGLADAKDTRRGWFLWESLKGLYKAVDEGVPVFGYLHWSLMDNFEWASGYWPRFGLIEIDRKNNLKRKVRPSAELYRDIIKFGLTEKVAKKWQHLIVLPEHLKKKENK